ncbi:DUF4238 domain-containing protein [Denitratisoma oestradiolicum]|uniref:DUF4238 domain-containing protein n=1 Tax=Denitratisoma oestradiolicum TaxID=311182 RepID=A0A6S6XY73_9PROT|nr:DUF4238 domain-containing protein [Denitratisoma oestradiolicum]CAB1369841.1 conserved protein of unknown function [Denitratisoma oestradiolicum]
MAGRKQHYIPQSVQRAFEASRTGTKSQVLVFRKGKKPYVTSTEGSAAERDFYSNHLVDGEGALDDKITDFENEHLTAMLRELRVTKRGSVDSELAAITVAHLAFRTAHVRGSMQTVADDAVEHMKALIDDRDAIRHFVGVDTATCDSQLAERVRENLSELGLDAWPQKDRIAIERMVMFRVRERFDDLFLQSQSSLRTALAILDNIVPGSIATGHARVLSESLVPPGRVKVLRTFEWEVIPADDGQCPFILPDCVVIASSSSKDYQPFSMLSIEEAATVVMPLSPNQLLVGGRIPVRIDPAYVNMDFARCSLEFFISSLHDEGNFRLAELIGGYTAELKKDLFETEEAAPLSTTCTTDQMAKVQIRTPIGKTGEAMKQVLSRIVGEVIEPVWADRVESITVASNMTSALEAVWKRTPTPAELSAAALGTVEAANSGGDWKYRVIVPRNLAQALLKTADQAGQLAASRVVKMHLGRVYYLDCWACRVPEMLGPRLELSLWERIASITALRVGSHYFGGLASARHESEPFPGGNRLDELAANLRHCFTALRQARQQAFMHRNVDQVLADAIGPIDTLLVSVATVSGFLNAKDLALPHDSDAGDALSKAGLWEWYLLFAKDLGRHYATRERWASPSDLEPLIGHIERLLWTVGVIVSKTDSGLWIDVIDDARMPVLEKILLA